PPTPPLFPYTTLFRSAPRGSRGQGAGGRAAPVPPEPRDRRPAALRGLPRARRLAPGRAAPAHRNRDEPMSGPGLRGGDRPADGDPARLVAPAARRRARRVGEPCRALAAVPVGAGVSRAPRRRPRPAASPAGDPRRAMILALDQGTSGSTALCVDTEGRVASRGYAELTQHYPRPGWVEHDPDEIWATTVAAARAALAGRDVAGRTIAAIGITNQRETTIVWDRATGRPIHPAIVWQCRRTADLCERLRADGVEPTVRARTGLVLDAYFSGTKICWLLDAVSG